MPGEGPVASGRSLYPREVPRVDGPSSRCYVSKRGGSARVEGRVTVSWEGEDQSGSNFAVKWRISFGWETMRTPRNSPRRATMRPVTSAT